MHTPSFLDPEPGKGASLRLEKHVDRNDGGGKRGEIWSGATNVVSSNSVFVSYTFAARLPAKYEKYDH